MATDMAFLQPHVDRQNQRTSPENGRPYKYPKHVVKLQGHNREQRHVDESVGAWKAALKN